MTEPQPVPDPGALLDQVLDPLLQDFDASFQRGLELLQRCPPQALDLERQQRLRARLEQAAAELGSARALRRAMPVPMALEMKLIQSWHQLVLEVWGLSAPIRRSAGPPASESSPAAP